MTRVRAHPTSTLRARGFNWSRVLAADASYLRADVEVLAVGADKEVPVTTHESGCWEGLKDGATLRSLSSGGLRVLPRAAPLPVTL